MYQYLFRTRPRPVTQKSFGKSNFHRRARGRRKQKSGSVYFAVKMKRFSNWLRNNTNKVLITLISQVSAAQRESAWLSPERSWVRIPPGLHFLFLFFYFILFKKRCTFGDIHIKFYKEKTLKYAIKTAVYGVRERLKTAVVRPFLGVLFSLGFGKKKSFR